MLEQNLLLKDCEIPLDVLNIAFDQLNDQYPYLLRERPKTKSLFLTNKNGLMIATFEDTKTARAFEVLINTFIEKARIAKKFS